MRNYKPISGKITRHACHWVWILAVFVQKQVLYCVSIFLRYCSCLTGGLKWEGLCLLNGMQILGSVYWISQKRFGQDPASVTDQ